MNAGGAGADMIRDRERASPGFRRDLALKGSEQRLRIRVRNRQDRNFGDRLGVFDLETLRAGNGADSGSQRIARIVGIHDAATLHTFPRPPTSSGIVVPLKKPSPLGIGVDDASDSSMFGGNFGLDAPPSGSVTSDDDCTLDGNAHAVEFFVVFAIAVVHVHERGGHVSINGVGIVGGKLLGGLVRSWVDGESWFLQLGSEFCRSDEFDDALLGSGKEDVESFDVGVESPLLELGENPLGIVFVVGRSNVVGTGRQTAHVLADVCGDNSVLKFLLRGIAL